MIYETIKQSGTQYCTAAAALLAAYYLIPYLVDPHDYRRRFSGPWFASLTNLWLARAGSSGHYCKDLHELHEKYGRFVRIGPNHISIADPDALEIVYGHSSGLLKSEFYEILQSAETKDVFSARDKVVHTMKRKRIANIYSAQNVLSFEPRVKEHIRRFYIQLDNRCEQALKGKSGFNWSVQKGRAVLNICPQFAYLSFDIISDLALGVPFGMVERQKDSTPASLSTVSERNVEGVPIIRLIADGGKIGLAIGPYPAWFQKLLIMAPWHKNDSDSRRNYLETTKALVDARISRIGREQPEDQERGPDLLDKLFEVRNPDGSPMSRKEIDSEALVTIGAGSDTTANSLSALCYYVASNSVIKSRLQKELDSALSSVEEPGKDQSGVTPPSHEQVKDLPYLNACIKEALRLYSTIGLGLPRTVPAGKTLKIAGEIFNEGSVISVPSYSTNRSNVWGPDSHDYRPERWLEDGSTALSKYFVPFSTGPRACIGRNLANMNMLLISAAFFHRYDVELANPDAKLEVADAFVRDATRCEVSLKRRF
ncbi:Cytochrome P450 monooxygenase, partial [Rhizoctonia solani]